VRSIQKSIAECIARADFVSVAPDDLVTTAVSGMQAKGTNCALVVDREKLIGIFTERDFLHRIAAEGRDPATIPMRQVMTPDPETLRAHDSVTYAINRMAVRKYRNVPIVDRNGRPTSVLDARLVMMHLIKVFAELDQGGGDHDAWIDIGGG